LPSQSKTLTKCEGFFMFLFKYTNLSCTMEFEENITKGFISLIYGGYVYA
jgi:hypothetical protein